MSNERRRYFRIDDEVLLDFRTVDKSDQELRIEEFWSNEHAWSIRNNYNYQIEQHIADRHKIAARMPELGRYLGVLEQQIDRITGALMVDEQDQSMTRKTVNLSAQGVTFTSDEPPAEGELVELKLKLISSGMRLLILARAVVVGKSDINDQGGHRVSLDFEHIHEAEREILIKHAAARQQQLLSGTGKNSRQ